MADDREPLGRIFHEQGRLTVNSEREKPFAVEGWELRTDEQQEIDMRGAFAVAARAVADAGLEDSRKDAQLFALRVHLPAIRGALVIAEEQAAAGGYGAHAKAYHAALEALSGTEEEKRDEH